MSKLLNFVLCLMISLVNGEIFSAIEKLEKLAKAEKVMIEQLRDFSLRVNDDYVKK